MKQNTLLIFSSQLIMNKMLIFSFLIFGFSDILFAQTHQIALVKPDGTTTIHSTFQSAYDAAQDDDKIYLPGGTFISPEIHKKLHIYGAGWDESFCLSTGITILGYETGVHSLGFFSNASGGSLTGIKTIGALDLDGVIGFSATKCYFKSGIAILYNNCSNINLLNSYIGKYEWFDRSFYFVNANLFNSLISNCIIISHFGEGIGPKGDTLTIVNNIFFKPNVLLPPNSTFENNIFKDGCSTSNSMFSNNTNVSVQNDNNNIYIDNISESWPDIFVDPGPDPYDYNKENDYHVKASSQSHNSGTDGTDRGIYGGPFPWTPGSVPPNPHIISKTVNRTSDTNGNLHINVTVGAGN